MTNKRLEQLKNVVLYVLKDFSGGTDYIKLYKILYFANKRQLAEVGVPLIHDKFKAWNYGPVPSIVGSVVKHLEARQPLTPEVAMFNGALKVRKNKRVMAMQQPDVAAIPSVTRAFIDEYIAKYKYYNSKQLSLDSHDEAWREAFEVRGGRHDGTKVIKPVLMASTVTDDEIALQFVKRYYGHDKRYVRVSDKSSRTEAFEQAVLELRSFSVLRDGWDGDDAGPVSTKAILNCRDILSQAISRPELLSEVYPTPSGTVCLEWRRDDCKVNVEVSGRQMSFYTVEPSGGYDSPVCEVGEDAFADLFNAIARIAEK